MERYDCDSSADFKRFCQELNSSVKFVKLAVYFDSDCLKGSFCRMSEFPSDRRRITIFNDFGKFGCRSYAFFCSDCRYPFRYSSGKLIFAVFRNNSFELCNRIFVYDVKRRQILVLIHSHIERSVFNVRKAAFRIVDLIGRNSEIQKHSV